MSIVLFVQSCLIVCSTICVVAVLFTMVRHPETINVPVMLSLSIALSFLGTFVHEIAIEYFNRLSK